MADKKKRTKRTGHERVGGRPKREVERFAFFISTSDKEFMENVVKRENGSKSDIDAQTTLADIVRRACREFVQREEEKVKASAP